MDKKSKLMVLNEDTIGLVPIVEGKFSMSIGFAALLFACPGLISAEAVKANLENGDSIQQAVDNAESDAGEKTVKGEYSQADIANILARTLFGEAGSESYEGKLYVATVIYNRADGKVNRFVKVVFDPSQFSMWNAIQPATNSKYNPSNYRQVVPKEVLKDERSFKSWEECKKIASDLVLGKFTPKKGNYNAYYNETKASATAKATWGKKMTGKKVVGKHTFGYLTDQDPKYSTRYSDPIKVTGSTTYTVQKGDTSIDSIAKKLISSKQTKFKNAAQFTKEILKLNAGSLKKNAKGHPIIKLGQTIKIPTL